MKQLIENFPSQLEEALQIASASTLKPSAIPFSNVIISGLGGSGIGGTIASQLAEAESPIPVIVNKKYTLPAFAGRDTLVIISSYSGNTEETISTLREAMVKGCHIVCITSGGEIASVAGASGLDLITLPGGMPPRACLGYSLVQLLHILQFHKVFSHDYLSEVKEAAGFLREELKSVQLEARLAAERLHKRIPVIYAADDKEGIAVRFRQQINENSKMLAWHHVFPELNHNELVGWRNDYNQVAVVLMKYDSDLERIGVRMNISEEIFRKYTGTIIELRSRGRNLIESHLYMIHFGDWISWFLAELNKVDATEVKVIDHLKSELSKA